MLAQYHISVLAETIGPHFSAEALRQIIRANLKQDDFLNLLNPRIHFDNSMFAEGLAYVEEQHAIIARADDPLAMRAAFGRLTHAVQDFYSHSNYVDLWLKTNGGLEHSRPEDIDGLDPKLHNSPELRSGYIWRDAIHYIPVLNLFTRKYLVFPGSHEAMHLDDPSRGPQFAYSIVAAKQRTLAEYQRAVSALGAERAALFHG